MPDQVGHDERLEFPKGQLLSADYRLLIYLLVGKALVAGGEVYDAVGGGGAAFFTYFANKT